MDMRRSSRIRRMAKWSGLAACVLIVAAWAGTALSEFKGTATIGSTGLMLCDGTVLLCRPSQRCRQYVRDFQIVENALDRQVEDGLAENTTWSMIYQNVWSASSGPWITAHGFSFPHRWGAGHGEVLWWFLLIPVWIPLLVAVIPTG